MAHAAPASRRRTARPRPSTDVFSPRAHRIASIAVPVVLGLVYGYWVAADRRSGGEITGWNLLLGFVSAVVFMLLWIAGVGLMFISVAHRSAGALRTGL